MRLPWVGVNRGLMGEERISKRLPKMIYDVSCIFKISLCQCGYKGISSTAFFYHNHFGEETFQDSFEFVSADSQEPPSL